MPLPDDLNPAIEHLLAARDIVAAHVTQPLAATPQLARDLAARHAAVAGVAAAITGVYGLDPDPFKEYREQRAAQRRPFVRSEPITTLAPDGRYLTDREAREESKK